MDKSAQTVGFSWIIGLVFIFILGVGYIVYNQVMTVNIEPLSDSLIDSSPYLNATEVSELKENNDKYMSFWHSTPFIMFLLLIIYVLVTGFKKGERYA